MFRRKQTFPTYVARSYRKRPPAPRTRTGGNRGNLRLQAPAVIVILLAVVGGVFGFIALRHASPPIHAQVVRTTSPRLTPMSVPAQTHALTPAAQLTQTQVPAPPSPQIISPPQQTPCSNNQDSQLILVSISQQHMWTCSGTQLAYNTPVTTGAYEIPGDETPTGTWHIFDKETNLYLTGPGYKDFVQYWMPFYSDYGFHDASWQTFPFGGSEYPTQGSHGCIHLPAAAASWLYNWASIGTTVTIQA